jgi:hypothetical protein
LQSRPESCLRALQLRFAAALFDGAVTPIESAIVAAGIPESARIDIYRNNLREGFRNALALEFPVIERLVGEDYFRQLVGEFLGAHPSCCGDLHFVGAPFPMYLRARFSATEYAYLGDVADLEWAHEEVLVAEDAVPIAPQALAQFAPEHYPLLRFVLHPATRLVSSPFPVVRIWMANQPDASTLESIDLRSGADRVLVRRGRQEVEFHTLTAGELALIAALDRGFTLGPALDAALLAESSFDLSQGLSRALALGVFAAARL